MKNIAQSVEQRIKQSADQYKETILAVKRGRPFEAERDPGRAKSRLNVGAFLDMPFAVPGIAETESEVYHKGMPERIWGNTADFVGVAFLELGVQAARAVGRIAWEDDRAIGSGFLVAPKLFLTNNHVIESAADANQFVVEFDYEIAPDGQRRDVTRFQFEPGHFFITDDIDDLDYTLIAIGSRISGSENLDAFGYNPLSAAGNKHAIGEVANIVQHPEGRMKEVVLRENRLVSRLTHVLHYVADTEPGSSGSPVFNNQWQAIALHHWGGPWRQTHDIHGYPIPRYVNEGVRISAIVNELRDRIDELPIGQRDILEQALMLGEKTRGIPQQISTQAQDDSMGVRIRADGVAVWRIPIEIAVGMPGTSGSAASVSSPAPTRTSVPQSEAFKRKVDKNYDNRKGYQPGFLTGYVIPMPSLTPEVESRMAKNTEAEPGEDELAFSYQHFSVYVDRKRGLPLVTACNIDGKNLKSINRTTGDVSHAENIPIEPLPEAREKWYVDPRIATDECGNDELYTNQRVSSGPNRLGRIFHRGHMVRRLDPCWGSKTRALRAEADTFHFTNCTPQVGKFNSGKSLWQGIENHVLDNARVDDIRVTVFTGTVLNDANDPLYRQDVFPGFRVPMRFWKIAIWVDDGHLSALAMIADQSDSLRELPEGMEAIDDDEGVKDFITTVVDIENLTGLDFGSDVRNADINKAGGPEGASARREVLNFPEIPLERKPRPRKDSNRKS